MIVLKLLVVIILLSLTGPCKFDSYFHAAAYTSSTASKQAAVCHN